MMKTTQAAVLLSALLSGAAFGQYADKAVVDDLIAKHNEAGKQITAFVEHVNDGFEKVGEHLNTLNDEKADKTEVADLKNKTLQAFQEMTQAVAADLETKADKTALDAKADKTELDKKADKAVVDDLIEKHNEAGKQITAFVEHVNDGFEKVGEHLNTLNDEKADKTEVADLKNKTLQAFQEMTQAVAADLETKADKTALDAKADKTELDKKADKVSVDAVKQQVANVAVTTYRLDRDIQQTQEAVASNAEALANHADAIIDLSQNKADKTELDKKADKAEFDNFKEETVTNVENVGTIALGAEAAVNDLLDALYGKEGTDESGQLGEMSDAINEKADKSEVADLKNKTLQAFQEMTQAVAADLETKADKTELDKKADKAEFDNFKEETVANVENVGTIALGAEATVNDLLDALYGKEGTDESGQLGEMSDAINQKADKAVVDDLIAKHNEAGKQITAFVEHVNDGFEKVGEHLNTLADEKADKTALDAKADKSELDAKADKSELEAKADKVELAKKANQADVDTALALKADKVALDAKADKSELEAKADKVELAKKANQTDVDTALALKADKVALDAKADQKVVAANTARIAGVENRVNGLESDMKHGFAAQAALAGLFQPYNIGKVNVTAAVGGYKSKAALAVGAGYRYNENIAAKAGVAFSNKGGAAYHVGVNYEF